MTVARVLALAAALAGLAAVLIVGLEACRYRARDRWVRSVVDQAHQERQP